MYIYMLIYLFICMFHYRSKTTPKTEALQQRHSTSIYFSDNYAQLFKDKCSRTHKETNHTKQLVLNE